MPCMRKGWRFKKRGTYGVFGVDIEKKPLYFGFSVNNF